MSGPVEGGRRSRMPSVSRSLQIVAVLLLVLIILVTGQQLLQLRSGLISDAERQMARLDMVFAEQTGRAVETVDLVLRDVVDDVHGTRATPGSLDEMLRRHIEGVRQVLEVTLYDPSGAIVSSSRPPGTRTELLPAGRSLLAYHAGHPGQDLQISEPIRIGDGPWMTLMSRRVNNPDGSFAGAVIAQLNLAYFEDFYKAVELSENGAIVLHRRDGLVLARYPHSDKAIGSSFAELSPFKEVLAHAIAGTVLMKSPVDGSIRVLAIRALRAFPLAVNVSVDQENVLAPWRQQTLVLTLVALCGSVVMGTLLLLLARASHRLESLLPEFRSAKEAAESANAALLVQMHERERAEAAMRQAQRIEAVGQLTGGVAHDFNNLLTVMLGNLDLMQHSEKLDQALKERLLRMRHAAERGATLVDQLLAFARRQPLSPRAVELNGVVSGMSGLLQSAIGNNIRIETRLANGLWPAMIDPTQIELVILNLAINARDAMPKGGTLTIETANTHMAGPAEDGSAPPGAPAAGDYIVVSVRDTGTGMAPEVLAKAFEPFFTTKGVGHGSGLGLSQVFGLARQSGGGVHLESSLGQGTTVRVYLPRAANAAIPAELMVVPEFAGGSASTILLVDDDEAVRSTTGMILETMGYKILSAESGQGALAVLRSDIAIDLLLTDVAMPGMNGPQLARQVRVVRPSLPIVFFSGYADPEAVAGDTIRQRIVRKPFRAADLAAQIEIALKEARAAA